MTGCFWTLHTDLISSFCSGVKSFLYLFFFFFFPLLIRLFVWRCEKGEKEKRPLNKSEEALVPEDREKTLLIPKVHKVLDDLVDHTEGHVILLVEDDTDEHARGSIVRQLL